MADSEFQQLAKTDRNPVQETRYQELLKSQGGGGGVDFGAIDSVLSSQRSGNQALLSSQNAQQQDYLDRFRSAIYGQEALPAMASRIGDELGLPTLQKNATYLNTQVANMPFTQRDLTRGFNVNQNQLSNLINQKVYELTPALTTTNNALSSAQQSKDEQMGYNVAMQNKELIPYQTEQSLLSDRLARETTMYTQQNQNELSSILKKVELGVQISEAEKNRAHDLAMQENNFEAEKQRLSMQGSDQNRYISGSQFYDTTTGQWITAPKTGSGSNGSTVNWNLLQNPTTQKQNVPYGVPGAAGYQAPARPTLGNLFNL